jgi:hypothetical protein
VVRTAIPSSDATDSITSKERSVPCDGAYTTKVIVHQILGASLKLPTKYIAEIYVAIVRLVSKAMLTCSLVPRRRRTSLRISVCDQCLPELSRNFGDLFGILVENPA